MAIQANELRIDNWLALGKHNVPTQVFSINFDRDEGWLINKVPIGGNWLPIPLTPEILEKAGFAKHDNSNEFWTFWKLNNGWNLSQSQHSELSAGVKSGLFYWGDGYLEVKALHQLQNLYFSLTGTELEIKP
jgi:hypothetical protein